MRRIENKYGPDGVLTINSGVYGSVDILFDTDLTEHLKQYRWCWEQSKAQAYCTDLSLTLPTLLGYKTARVYLSAYIMHLRHGDARRPWIRTATNDYRTK